MHCISIYISRLPESFGPPYLCSTGQWLDEGWIGGGYTPDKVLVYLAFIHIISVQYPQCTNAYALSTHHLDTNTLSALYLCMLT